MASYIGIVDLTVRHSSMNPLGHIDVNEASVSFERIILNACAESLRRRGPDAIQTRAMLDRGIVTQGGAAKLFQFQEAEDAVQFATHLRSLLIEKQLPFKLCLAQGELGPQSIRDVWAPKVIQAQGGDTEARRDLLRHFNTCEVEEIEELFKAYRVPGFHQDEVYLALELDAFKGFGIWIDKSIALSREMVKAHRFFRNHHPLGVGSRSTPQSGEFIDIRFDVDADDVVAREKGSSAPVVLPTGQSSYISDVMDLLRRSMKAADENSMFYVSLITTIVRSSNFTRLRKFAKSTEATRDGPGLLAGWQEHPPIFHTLLVDSGARQAFRRVVGLELVLGAIVDEVYAAETSVEPSCGIEPAKPPERGKALAALDPQGNFAEVVKAIESTYGEQMLRRMWSVPDAVLSRDRKTAALKVTTDR